MYKILQIPFPSPFPFPFPPSLSPFPLPIPLSPPHLPSLSRHNLPLMCYHQEVLHDVSFPPFLLCRRLSFTFLRGCWHLDIYSASPSSLSFPDRKMYLSLDRGTLRQGLGSQLRPGHCRGRKIGIWGSDGKEGPGSQHCNGKGQLKGAWTWGCSAVGDGGGAEAGDSVDSMGASFTSSRTLLSLGKGGKPWLFQELRKEKIWLPREGQGSRRFSWVNSSLTTDWHGLTSLTGHSAYFLPQLSAPSWLNVGEQRCVFPQGWMASGPELSWVAKYVWRLKWGWDRDGNGADRTGALCLGHAEALPRWSVLRLDRAWAMKSSEAGLSELSCSRSGDSGPAHISEPGGVSS